MVDLVAIFSDPANIAALATLIAMEVVLGIRQSHFHLHPNQQASGASALDSAQGGHQRGADSEVGLPELGLPHRATH